ncbi:MAG: M81 family metallopeptidase [Erysipelotrichaceae bacterium]|nr:M81 family metallopeptidase [Erysipelotrichaceae bacterium]
MKVLIGAFIAECNMHTGKNATIEDFTIESGEILFDRMYIRKEAEELGVELVPAIYACANACGVIEYDTFDYIRKQFVKYAKKYKGEVDGMFFFFHGASNVEDLPGGSGDHALVQAIRDVVGPYMPIAMVCDPHGNLSQQQADNCNIVRTFRHSPHTDRQEAHKIVFKSLVNLLNRRRLIHPAYRKVPIMLGGERCVSTDEPLVSINKFLDEIEADPRILVASYTIGYLRHDSDKCGAGIMVVPMDPCDKEYAEQKADEIYKFVMERRHEFHFHGYADVPEVALQVMLEEPEGPLYLTDSGDNVTAGGPGCNTTVLKQVLALDDFHNKNILFASIVDKDLFDNVLSYKKIGDHVEVDLGAELNELSGKVHICGTVISKGDLHRHYHDDTVVGNCCNVKLDNVPVTVCIANKEVSFSEKAQYDAAGLDWDRYDLYIVKQGYLYPDLKARANNYVMSLTDGVCYQRTETYQYKCIMRPMYPYDDDFE